MPSKTTRGWGWRWGLGLAGVGFEPTDIAGLDLWLKADAITGLSNGDPVTTWSDQSGNSNDVTQSTTAKKPTYKTSIINSLPVVRFDGTDDLLVLADSLSTATEGTIFVVFQLTSTHGNAQTLVASSDEASDTRYLVCRGYRRSEDPYMEILQLNADTLDRVEGSTSISDSTPYLQVFQSDGSEYIYRLDGGAETEAVVSGANSGDWLGDVANRDNFTVGMLKRTTEIQCVKGDIAEVVVYDTSLSAEDLGDVETYLNGRWAIY